MDDVRDPVLPPGLTTSVGGVASVAVNRGVPVPLSAPRCGVSKALSDMATTLVAAPGSSEGRRGRRRGKAAVEGSSRRGSVKLRKAA